MKKSIVLILLTILGFSVLAQKNKVITINTSAQCEMCAERIETELNSHDGIKGVKVDFIEQTILVKYSSLITNEEHIKEMIAEIGYDADEVKAHKEAYDKLPCCCKKPIDQKEGDKME